MKTTIKSAPRSEDGFRHPMAYIRFRGAQQHVRVAPSVSVFLRNVKRVEISNKPFNGCSRQAIVPVSPDDAIYNTSGCLIEGKWVCNEWLTKLGLVSKVIYYKIRR